MHDAKREAGLCVSDLELQLDGRVLLSNINFTLSARGITVLMGPNGAGKSLLLRVLHGLIPATRGEVDWSGEPISTDLTRRQSLVFQAPVLLRRSVAANLDFVLRARGQFDREKRNHALAQVGLLELARHPARALSGGEKQRLALARALVTAPEALLLDEPTANLDPAAVDAIENTVRQTAAEGAKVVFVTHDIGQARRLAEDVLFLHRGELLEHQSSEEFFAKPSSAAARSYLEGKITL